MYARRGACHLTLKQDSKRTRLGGTANQSLWKRQRKQRSSIPCTPAAGEPRFAVDPLRGKSWCLGWNISESRSAVDRLFCMGGSDCGMARETISPEWAPAYDKARGIAAGIRWAVVTSSLDCCGFAAQRYPFRLTTKCWACSKHYQDRACAVFPRQGCSRRVTSRHRRPAGGLRGKLRLTHIAGLNGRMAPTASIKPRLPGRKRAQV